GRAGQAHGRDAVCSIQSFTPSVRDYAAVDDDHLPRREATILRCKKEQRAYEILGHLLAADRTSGKDASAQAVRKIRIAPNTFTEHEPRSERVHTDPVVAHLPSERARERHDCAF